MVQVDMFGYVPAPKVRKLRAPRAKKPTKVEKMIDGLQHGTWTLKRGSFKFVPAKPEGVLL